MDGLLYVNVEYRVRAEMNTSTTGRKWMANTTYNAIIWLSVSSMIAGMSSFAKRQSGIYGNFVMSDHIMFIYPKQDLSLTIS
jgi:hypothetical protein